MYQQVVVEMKDSIPKARLLHPSIYLLLHRGLGCLDAFGENPLKLPRNSPKRCFLPDRGRDGAKHTKGGEPQVIGSPLATCREAPRAGQELEEEWSKL